MAEEETKAGDVTIDSLFRGLYSTEHTELERVSVPVSGELPLPAWLKGTWMKNGTGVYEVGERRFEHMFDAFAKLHSFTFPGDGSCLFTCKMLKTESYKASMAQGDIADYMLMAGTVPQKSSWAKVKSMMNGMDNTIINVHRYGPSGAAEYHAVSDFWPTHQFEPRTLDTVRYSNVALPGGMSCLGRLFKIPLVASSHALREYGTDNVINFAGVWNPCGDQELRVVRIKSNEDRELVCTIGMPQVPYMHSFALTQHYMVLFAHPAFMDTKVVTKLGAAVDAFVWRPEEGMQVYVVNLQTGTYTQLSAEPILIMHQANAYEQVPNEILVIDVTTYDDVSFFRRTLLHNYLDAEKRSQNVIQSTLLRYTINLKEGTITVQPRPPPTSEPTSSSLEFPVINEKYRCLPYRYVYGVVPTEYGPSTTRLCKKDQEDSSQDKFWSREHHYMSEPAFVPDPEGETEDAGLLLTHVYHPGQDKSYVAVLDARTFELRNEIQLPVKIPFALHGQFFSDLV